jgi:ATP-binding cassette subfamily B protein
MEKKTQNKAYRKERTFKVKNRGKNGPRYSMVNNILFIITKTFRIDKALIGFCVLQIPAVVLIPLLATYLSRTVVELVFTRSELSRLVLFTCSVSAGLLFLNLLNHYASAKIRWRSFSGRFSLIAMTADKTMHSDYCNMESPEGQVKMQKAFNALYNINSGAQQIFAQISAIISNAIGLTVYSALITSLNPWIVPGLVILSLVSYYSQRVFNNWVHKNRDNWVPLDRQIYYVRQKSGDYAAAKDIRLFNMAKWFIDVYESVFKKRMEWNKKTERRRFAAGLIPLLATFLRDSGAYAYLIYMVTQGHISVSDFVFYFGLISSYSGWMTGVINALGEIHASSLSIQDVRDFLDMPDQFNRSAGVPLPEDTCEISFENVSFSYPGSDRLILDNISLHIMFQSPGPGSLNIPVTGTNSFFHCYRGNRSMTFLS